MRWSISWFQLHVLVVLIISDQPVINYSTVTPDQKQAAQSGNAPVQVKLTVTECFLFLRLCVRDCALPPVGLRHCLPYRSFHCVLDQRRVNQQWRQNTTPARCVMHSGFTAASLCATFNHLLKNTFIVIILAKFWVIHNTNYFLQKNGSLGETTKPERAQTVKNGL